MRMMPKASLSSSRLWQYLNRRVEDLRQVIPRAQRTWSRKAIHRARVTTRRVKAAIDLLEPLLTEKSRRSFTNILRSLRRGLGPLRDQDIMLKHLQGLQKRHTSRAAVQWLSARLEKERVRLQRKCARKHPTEKMLAGLGRWWGLEQEIKEVEPAARSLARTLVPGQLKSFTDRADQLTAAHLGDASSSQEDVHALRIAGKMLRYTLELAEPLGFELPRSILNSFKKMQDALGLWHDYMVLGQETLRAALEDELPLHNPALHGEALSLARLCWRRSERYLNRFARLWSENGHTLPQQISDVFALQVAQAQPQSFSSTAVVSSVSL